SHHAERHRVLRAPGRQLLRRLGRRQAVRPAGQLRHDVVDLDRARPRLGPAALADRRGAARAAGRCRAAAGVTMTEGWRSVVLWSAASLLVAAVAVSFVMWGLNGPAYLIDLIA